MAADEITPIPVPTSSVEPANPALAIKEGTAIPPSEQVIPIPPTPVLASGAGAVTREQAIPRFNIADGVLLLLTFVFAFILAAFSIRNNDMFQQLAVGRLIANGEYSFGQDPISWTSQPVSWANSLTGEKIVWVNHAWLFDLGTYGLYRLDESGAVLVVCKALLVVVTVGLLVLTGRRIGRPLFVPTLAAGLAVLVMSPRLFFQPAVASMLLLALTFYLLERPRLQREANAAATGLGSWWLLPLVFALWVNLDQWFVLGPLVVALYLVGSLLQARFGPPLAPTDVQAPKTLAMVLLVSVLACLVNPYHIHAFVLPEQLGLSAAAQEISSDRLLASYFASPFAFGGPFFLSSYFSSVAGLSYLFLLLIGLGSFLAVGLKNRFAWRWDRVLLFVVLAFLSGYSARGIPFFAVAAGPIVALNFLDASAAIAMAGRLNPHWSRYLIAARVASLLAVLLLGTASVYGLTQSRPQTARQLGLQTARQLGFQLIPDESKKALAEKVASLRSRNLLPPDIHWFTTQFDIANYFSWYCPGERISFDQRVNLYPQAAEDFKKVRDALAASPDAYRDKEPPWREVFRRNHVRFVVVYEDDLLGQPITMERILRDPEEWTLLHLDGKGMLVVWNDPAFKSDDPARPDPYTRLTWSPNREAFNPQAVQVGPSGPLKEPHLHSWYEEIWNPMPMTPADAFQAKACGMYFRAHAPRDQIHMIQAVHVEVIKHLFDLGCLSANPAVGLPPISLGMAGQLRFLVSAYETAYQRRNPPPPNRPQDNQPMDLEARAIMEQRRLEIDIGPPGALYLGIRSARRALAASPDEARTYYTLGDLYYQLANSTRERYFSAHSPLLTLIREAQTMSAFQQASRLEPDNSEYHERLGNLYLQSGYLDLAVKEKREEIRCLRLLRIPDNEMGRGVEREIDARDRDVHRFEERIKHEQEDNYLLVAGDKDFLDQAALAMSPSRPMPWLATKPFRQQPYGLIERALDALGKVPQDKRVIRRGNDAEAPTVVAGVDILLRLGRLKEAREILHPDPEEFDSMRNLLGPHHGLRRGGNDWIPLPAFEVFKVCVAAAEGNEKETDKAMGELLAATASPEKIKTFNHFVAATVGQMLLNESVRSQSLRPLLPVTVRPNKAGVQVTPTAPWQTLYDDPSVFLTFQQIALKADLLAIRGWLALEAGRIDRARDYLEQSLQVGAEFNVPRLQNTLQGMAKIGLQWLDKNR